MKDEPILGKEKTLKRLESYIESLGLNSNCITISNEAVFVKFPEEFKCTPEHLVDIKNIFFWNLEVPFSAGIINFTLCTNTLSIKLTYYEFAAQVFEALERFGMKLIKYDMGIQAFSFSYFPPGLCYEELETIRTIVNPARNNNHSVHQITMHGITDLFIHPDTQ